MIKNIVVITALIAVSAMLYVAYSFFRTPAEASAPVEAVPIQLTVSSSEAEPTVAAVANEEAQQSSSATQATATAEETTQETTQETDQASGAGLRIYEIVQSGSEARFYIDEVLRSQPVTVVGATDQVAGQLALDPDDLTTVQIGAIQVNARALATDSEFRDRAIKNRILLTDDHEYIVFEPTSIVGLPNTGSVGSSYTFQIVGDLTVTDNTREVTFDATVASVSDERLEGTATTTILYADFGLTIPASQSVDAVADEVILEIDFVAEAVQ